MSCFWACTALFLSCASQKDNATNRSLQNLSARYNLIYNANVLLNTYQDDLALANADNYDHILSVYIAPPPIDYLSATSAANDTKTLDEIAQKAETIVAEKGLSNYVDEAYILLAKTNFYRGNYFSAAAYFDYAAKAYSGQRNVFVNAMNWKARSLMQLDNDGQAMKVLDTVSLFLDSIKKEKAEALATLAQMNIYQQDYPKAISHLEAAIKEGTKAQNKIRWSYILAQLYENEKQYAQSLRNYTRVEKSNAPFEMYFNAKLSKIRINDQLSSQTSNRREQLLKLLKDDKNIDYTDQIYYEVAEDYFSHQDYAKAAEYYQLSAKKSQRNVNQKGLSYLRLADLNFKNLGNYVDAKLYYDSAALILPKTYPGYEAILKKAQNLEYLTERYQQIAAQDTLQHLARLPRQERLSRMDKMFANAQKGALETRTTNIPATANTPNAGLPTNNPTNSTFYFSNLAAVGKGFTDFKRRWGNRILEDNWRQSVKSSAQVNQQNLANATDQPTTGQDKLQTQAPLDREAQIAAFEATLPLTPELLKISDQKIIDAYFEIAGFYQQVLGDQNEAIKVYQALLSRYPKNNHLETIYYSLYLANGTANRTEAERYKNLVLSQYPNSVYAKTILDPNFSLQQNALDLVVNSTYNAVFENYLKKEFPTVITKVNETNERFPGNNLQPQYDYLKAIAIGRTQHVDSLLQAFNLILSKYPSDPLITPLVKDHLVYINTHLPTFKARKIALTDFDPTEPRFIAQQNQTAAAPAQKKNDPVIVDPKPASPTDLNAKTKPGTTVQPNIDVPSKNQLFSKAESDTYYYVVSVNDMSLSVSSSRFGIGQFNRGNYAGSGIKHQLFELEEDQLIFVGNFSSLSEVKSYADGITPQLPKIMKVPAATYKWFYISKENFDKIKNRETLNSYLEFFKNNY
ncbi:MAG: gliding motility protein [Pedobacter sp.]|nr:gliding motility protein [Pedobacter sp.]MDQ8052992.1 gliding motility protein [Pedobacter sp.]